MRNIILKFSGLLLVGHLLSWWLLFFSPLNIPETISGTPINVSGLTLIVLTVAILIFFQKQVLKRDNKITVLKLTFLGTIVCFLAELIFQAIRFPTTADTFSEKLYFFIRGVLIVSLLTTIISFFIALQLKTKKTGLLVLTIIIFFAMVLLLKYFFPSLFGLTNNGTWRLGNSRA